MYTSCVGARNVLGVLAAGPRGAVRVPTQLVGEVFFGGSVSHRGERELVRDIENDGPEGTSLPSSTDSVHNSGVMGDSRLADSKPGRGVHVCHHFSELGGGSRSGEQAMPDSGISEDPSAEVGGEAKGSQLSAELMYSSTHGSHGELPTNPVKGLS
jgi:hypothetical protein